MFLKAFLVAMKMIKTTLRGQTVHWIGAKLCFCLFPDSRDNFLIMLNFCGTIQENETTKEKQMSTSLLRNPLTVHKLHSLAS